jgi:IS4 transposase
MFEDKDSIHLYDRGYTDYRWYDNLTESGIKFITRGVANASVMEERILNSNPQKDIYDTEIVMGSTPGGTLTFKSYREILMFDENGEPVTLITNIFDMPTEVIIDLYKKRWEIEIFFKWIKQNLKIKKFIGYNQNAVRIQIFSALISYMLIYLSGKIQNLKHSMLKLTRVISSNLLEEYDEDIIKYIESS